jgi:hypothetical protein
MTHNPLAVLDRFKIFERFHLHLDAGDRTFGNSCGSTPNWRVG